MERLMNYCDNIQYIDILTEDLTATCKFHEDLGLENVYQTVIKSGRYVAFILQSIVEVLLKYISMH